MKIKYPRQAQYFSVEAIRAMLFKILRQSISTLKKLINTQKQMDLPKIDKHKDQLIKNILICTESNNLRLKLIKFYESEKVDFNLVINIIE